jgi:hypothetical protein
VPTRGREDGAVCDEEIVEVVVASLLVGDAGPGVGPHWHSPHHVLSRRHLDISRDVRFAR